MPTFPAMSKSKLTYISCIWVQLLVELDAVRSTMQERQHMVSKEHQDKYVHVKNIYFSSFSIRRTHHESQMEIKKLIIFVESCILL